MKRAMQSWAGLFRPGVQRGLIAATQVLGLAVWLSVSAVVPSVQQELGMSSTATVWLTGSVQLGFVIWGHSPRPC